MRKRVRNGIAVLAVLLIAGTSEAPRAAEEPKRIGLVEKASTHLAQIDVTLSGKPEILETLGPDDFTVRVLFRKIRGVIVDRVCQPAAQQPQGDSPAAASVPPVARAIPVRSRPATYLFYYDQTHLTMTGRQRALDLSREIIPKVITGEATGMIVSSARELATIAPLTSSSPKLLEALGRLEKDRAQWSPYATLEESRVDEVLKILDDPMGGLHQAIGRARFYQAEETWEMQKSMNRLSMVMGALADVDPPKAVFYFADTMRSRPGGHFLSLFSDADQKYDSADQLQADASFGSMAMDRIITEAAAHGIRFYPIEAQGLVSLSMSQGIGFGASYFANNSKLPSSVRIHDAQDTLSAMALETGGQAFLNGVVGAKIANRVLKDLSCVFLLSFDASGLQLDEPLPISVQVGKPGVSVQARGRLVIQSESSRLTSRILAAFSTPQVTRSDVPLEVRLIPTGYAGGSFGALVQLLVPASKYPGASWDLGASVVSHGKVGADSSTRLEVSAAGVPLVFEQEMRFAPGEYEIVAVAHETSTDQISSKQAEGAWPDLRDVPAAVGPFAVLQPMAGLFRRNGSTLGRGFAARGENQPVRPEDPTAFVTLVCRGAGQKGSLRAERKLVGETSVNFDPQNLDLGGEPCAQIRDLVPAKTMGAGEFRYEVRVLKGDQEIARGERKFIVAAAPAPPAGTEAPPAPRTEVPPSQGGSP